MEKTISQVMARKTISQELLNPNSLLVISEYTGQYSYKEASVIFVEKDSIHEVTLAALNETTFIEYNENIVAIHGLMPGATEVNLISIFDLERHSFEEEPFIEMLYAEEKATVKKKVIK